MRQKTSPAARVSARSTKSAKSLPPQQPKTLFSPALKRAVPAASVAKAKKAFKGFNLSKFAGNGMPSNYVAAGESSVEAQRRMISRHIENQNNADSAIHGLTIALPDAMLKKLLPSFNAKARTIDLGEVISLIEQNMQGTEFYCSGNPTLNRMAIQSEVQRIIDNVKKRAHK